MFVLTNTAGASATTPPASKTTLFVDASGVPSTKNNGGTVTPLLTGPAAALAYQPLDADLTGIAGLTYAADKSIYYTGSAWATYDLTSVGRTLLAATTQAAQRTAIQAVGLVGDETVNGYKTWNSQHTWNLSATGSIIYGQPGGDSTGISMLFGTAGSQRRSDIRARGADILIGCSNVSDGSAPTRFFSIAHTDIKPNVTNVMSCGTASNLWTTVFATNTTISSSDARLKTEPRHLSEAERKAGSELARLPAIWEWLTGDRLHAGPTVQAAMAVMAARELDPFAYSFICYDDWEAEPATYDDEGNELTPAREAGDRYSFRKEELLCFMVAALAAENDLQASKVEALDARLAALEAKA